ncbi:MAG: hypothetical protein NWT02_07060 [Opitutales bacterium]|jgi:hypothetical protein|nr:hypothetical protein [Opitutales bacterium]MDP4645041.1 hypothetical protein [Opitutales bacterium]MDP4694582.1 hypothetical protein [Opitutales bacterium]MDP4776922.1 hypothetical protein [Opitutales bacterium]MDP4883040.1 hypothetical protein [Opitutales bacterium]
MKKSTITPLLILLALLPGCFVVSLQPFYAEDDVIADRSLAGEWQETGKQNKWHFKPSDDAKSYDIIITEGDDSTGFFIGTPFKIKEQFFIDIYPDTSNDNKLPMSSVYMIHRIPVHSLIHVKVSETTATLRVPSFAWFTKFLEEHPDALRHELIEDNFPVVTATTGELQDFWFKHLTTEDAYIETELTKLP